MQPVSKNKENDGFKRGGVASKYADLAAIVEALTEPLQSNGLAFSQDVTSSAEGVGVTTTLFHESGESLKSRPCWLPVPNKTPQGFGSAITYARRYSLSAFLGIVTEEDDDGNSASRSATVPAPAGVEGLKRSSTAPSSRPVARTGGAHPASVFPNYGALKGQPIHGAPLKDLNYYAGGARKTLADPAKANFHEKERKLLAEIEAEIAAQSKPPPGPPHSHGPQPGDYDEPPPPSDADAPF